MFAILGVSLWAGKLHYRCRETETPVNGDWKVVEKDIRVCGRRECPVGTCGSLVYAYDNWGNITVEIYRDTRIESLNYGVTNFDHLGHAFLTIF
jgi:hypothetical protein